MLIQRPALTLRLGAEQAVLHGADGAPVATAPLDALGTALAEWCGTAKAERRAIDVLLSDLHCRYLSVPRPAGVRNLDELQAAARHRFAAMFGALDDWALQHHAAPFGTHDLIVGVRRSVLAPFDQQALSARLPIRSIRPGWLAWVRHFAPSLRQGAHWVLSVDGHWLVVGYLHDNACRSVRSLRLHDGLRSVDDVLARELALVDDAQHDAPAWYGGHGLDPVSVRARLTYAGPDTLPGREARA
jgi:hypothetical protein